MKYMEAKHFDINKDMLHFYRKMINPDDLKNFIAIHGGTADTSKWKNLYSFIVLLNALNTSEQQENLIRNYDQFILNEMKLQRNANVGISYLSLDEKKLDLPLERFLEENGVRTIDEYNTLDIFKYIPTKHLKLIYRNLQAVGEKITGLTLVFARKIITQYNSQHGSQDIEFDWIEIDLEHQKATFYFPSENVNKLDTKFPSRPNSIFKKLEVILAEQYNIKLDNDKTQEQLYNMYHRLTSVNEKEYYEKVHYELTDTELVHRFCMGALSRLDKAEYKGPVDIEERIQNIFMRILITEDFNNYKEHVRVTAGSVESFIYKDPDGSSIVGKNGVNQLNGIVAQSVMENSTTYFDTKDTIESNEILYSLTVNWNKAVPGGQLVKYFGFQNLLLVHFVYGKVAEEVLANVLSNTKRFTETL